MALLSADDVLNKKFQPTKFREGYDQDEVDDFLDEVVNTLRAVYAENEELKARVASAESGAPASAQESAPTGGMAFSQEASPGREDEPQTAQTPFEQAVPQEQAYPTYEQPQQDPEQTQAQMAPIGSIMAEGGSEPESATGMLQLAQRLHDEYVSNGKAEADRLVGEARVESERMTREAEELRTRTLNQLEEERDILERKIDELRGFERDYRTRLKSYLEGLLTDVEGRVPAADPLGGSSSGSYDLGR